MSQVDPGHIVACHFPLRPTTPLAPATTPVSISSPNA
jgi:hypothetical protein